MLLLLACNQFIVFREEYFQEVKYLTRGFVVKAEKRGRTECPGLLVLSGTVARFRRIARFIVRWTRTAGLGTDQLISNVRFI